MAGSTPAATNRAILAGEPHDPLEELGPAAVVLRAVVQVDHQRLHAQESQADLLPPVLQAVHDEVAGDLRPGHGQPEVVLLRQEDPERRQRGLGLEVVVRRLGPGAAPARRENGPIFTVALASIEIAGRPWPDPPRG